MQGVRPSKPFQQYLAQGASPAQAAACMQQRYGVSVEKLALLAETAGYTRDLLTGLDPRAVSVYVGIPFCPTRCLYCSFPSHSLQSLGRERERFVQALIAEITALAAVVRQQQRPVDSVYIGGGTPTALGPLDLQRVLTALRRELPGGWRELTVEAGRPETLTSEQVAMLAGQGVQRISINPQTKSDQTLQLIGRQHSAAAIEAAWQRCRPHFPVINMDLILGLPGEALPDIQESLRWVLDFHPENITLHMFSPKRASRFSEEQAVWAGQLPDGAAARAMTAWCYQALRAAGYRPYYLYRQRGILGGQENVGWALPGTECRYNGLMIEECQDILGLGGGASSKFLRPGGKLENHSNPKDVQVYIRRGQQLIAEKLELLQTSVESGRCE